jgi:CxxC motif-containing protein
MEKIEKVCIVCPIGCNLTIEKDSKAPEGYKVTGNRCIRGEKYAISEMVNPTRVVTSTVKIKGVSDAMLPVKTQEAIPKGKMFDIINEIKSVEVELPIKRNDIIIENVCDTNINLIATKSIS